MVGPVALYSVAGLFIAINEILRLTSLCFLQQISLLATNLHSYVAKRTPFLGMIGHLW
jgi:hypothetical protein